jgi:hypothetical protein
MLFFCGMDAIRRAPLEEGKEVVGRGMLVMVSSSRGRSWYRSDDVDNVLIMRPGTP